jgi:hypothetical protein
MLSRKAVATARPTFASRRVSSIVVRASAEENTQAPVPAEAPINGVIVQATTPVAVPVAAAPAAPSLFEVCSCAVRAGSSAPCPVVHAFAPGQKLCGPQSATTTQRSPSSPRMLSLHDTSLIQSSSLHATESSGTTPSLMSILCMKSCGSHFAQVPTWSSLLVQLAISSQSDHAALLLPCLPVLAGHELLQPHRPW